MSLLKLSNLLLLHIISQIDNGDTVCLLLTCKQLYRNGSVRRLIRFKGIEAITDKGEISKQFIATATQFKLNTFKDILENSVSDQHVIFGEFCVLSPIVDTYPQWIQQRISATIDRVDKNNITTALVTNYQQPTIQSLYNIPSIKTLFIINKTKKERQEYLFYHNYSNSVVDLGSIALLSRLEHLSVYGVKQVKLGQHTTLKSLKLHVGTSYALADLGLTRFVSLTDLSFKNHFVSRMGPDQLPISLTSLTLTLSKTPPRDTFHSLKSLVKLKIWLRNQGGPIFEEEKKEEEEQKQAFIDLEHLPNLETFKLIDRINYPIICKCSIEISVPPSIKTLAIRSDWAHIPSQYVMPLLKTLCVHGKVLVDGNVSLKSSQSLKKLVIHECKDVIPANIIPSTVEKVTIHNHARDLYILGQVVFPPSLTHLSISGDPEYIKPPQSLVKLRLGYKGSIVLPLGLKKLSYCSTGSSCRLMTFPSNYPPNLDTIDLLQLKVDHLVIDNIPPSVTNLLMTLAKSSDWLYGGPTIFSITSKLTKDVVSQQQQWLPPSITHLTCKLLGDISEFVFRLDEVINHTNVRDLSIIIDDFSRGPHPTYHFSIQRLDTDNNNVLVLEKQTMTGGIITQRRITVIDQQQQQDDQQTQYHPIYLHLDSHSDPPFELKWSFVKDRYYDKDDDDEENESDHDDDSDDDKDSDNDDDSSWNTKYILENSVSDQHVIFGEFFEHLDNYPQWIQQRISSSTNRTSSDKSNITTALVTNYQQSTIQSIYNDIPSIETLFIFNKTKKHYYSNSNTNPVVDLGSIASSRTSFGSRCKRGASWSTYNTQVVGGGHLPCCACR
ncbi:hypothetical protein DFA_06333 [Cavenderia fasciculata]|uniref:F-box domain-containing protein n=1 Tax=Cavenderia fasciculata TaxID=261658 RepID=F4PKR2_CACFS|nr:uncharacterized protein DFA_06333 [Cavenderia fasciculata]EGG24186.1 hypothetical protein DFA_06333 [Cavenderia fasciculata]|eukprot:XP_004362037.1 hypothetical protein DFA_06333 [Cavenderia fasciculata]